MKFWEPDDEPKPQTGFFVQYIGCGLLLFAVLIFVVLAISRC